MIETLLLYFFAGATLLGAALMLVLRHPMRVAMALIATMLSLAGIYALLGMHAIAVFQVLIYVGAVMVFMVYAIMLLDVRDGSFARRYSGWLAPGIVAFLLLVATIGFGVSQGLPAWSAAADGAAFGLSQFSITFLTEYWLHFELVSVLLVAAIVGALAVIQVNRRRG
jgi:NADH-quinone oxidoreductase subunit J